jgi:hypothetical protein
MGVRELFREAEGGGGPVGLLGPDGDRGLSRDGGAGDIIVGDKERVETAGDVTGAIGPKELLRISGSNCCVLSGAVTAPTSFAPLATAVQSHALRSDSEDACNVHVLCCCGEKTVKQNGFPSVLIGIDSTLQPRSGIERRSLMS